MVDAVEALRNIGIEHVLGALLDAIEDRRDRIMGGASWTEPVDVRLKVSLPFGFEGKGEQLLRCAVAECRNAQRPVLVGASFGYPDPSQGLGRASKGERARQLQALWRRQ